MKTILLTGFQPFLDHPTNPSQDLCEELHGFSTPNSLVQSLTLPVTFDGAYKHVHEKIEILKPDILIATGLSAKRTSICLEKVAVNLNDCEHPDNAGVIKQNSKILGDSPDKHFTNFPIESLYDHLKKKNLNVELSIDAGHYVCNCLYYLIRNEHPDLPCLFVHIPEKDFQATKTCFQEIILCVTTNMANISD